MKSFLIAFFVSALCGAGISAIAAELQNPAISFKNPANKIAKSDSSSQFKIADVPSKSIKNLLDTFVTPEMFAAVGDGIADDTASVLKAEDYAIKSGKSLILLNKYHMNRQFQVDLRSVANSGFKITGSGISRSALIFDRTVPSPNMVVFASGNTAAFYDSLEDFSVKCNVAGTCLEIGKTDLSDQLNELKLDLVVTNARDNAEAVSMEMNAVYNADAILVVNGAGISSMGTALRLRQTQFSRFFGSFGNANLAVHLTGGYTVGNIFDAIDIEEGTIGVTIDSRNAQDNHFVAGTLAGLAHGYDAKAGFRNVVDGPSLGILPSKLFQNSVGIVARLSGRALIATPPLPPSGSPSVNSSGQEFFVYLIGGLVNKVTINGATVALSSEATFDLLPNDKIIIFYDEKSHPSWTWRAR